MLTVVFIVFWANRFLFLFYVNVFFIAELELVKKGG